MHSFFNALVSAGVMVAPFALPAQSQDRAALETHIEACRSFDEVNITEFSSETAECLDTALPNMASWNGYELFEDACLEGDAAACYFSGRLLISDWGLTRLPVMAMEQFALSCAGEFALGCMYYGYMAYSGFSTPLSDLTELEAHDAGCRLGAGGSCNELGIILLSSGRDPERAMAAYQRGCDLQFGTSCVNLSVIVHGGFYGVKPDEDRGRELFRLGCAYGAEDPNCQ